MNVITKLIFLISVSQVNLQAQNLNNNLLFYEELKAQIDAEIEMLGGINEKMYLAPNESRTLLMKYAEEGNLYAVKYIVEEKLADLNILDDYSSPRSAIIFPCYYGFVDIVEYFCSIKKQIITNEALVWAESGYLNQYYDLDIFMRIVKALNYKSLHKNCFELKDNKSRDKWIHGQK
jgi:hypothetical protein